MPCILLVVFFNKLMQSPFHYVGNILAGQGVQVTSRSKMLDIITLSEVKCDCDAKWTCILINYPHMLYN